MKYVEHEYIKKESLEYREYQVLSADYAIKANTLVVLPTGTGKTAIALLVAAEWLKRYKDTKIIFMAPTRPLVHQHEQYFQKMLDYDPLQLKVLSGEVSPETRKTLWGAKIIFATPQVVYNDLIKGYIKPSSTWLFIFDEAHRAVKEHSYTKVARIINTDIKPRILALTASPGDIEKTKEIMRNLNIEKLVVLTRSDQELRRYLQPVKMRLLEVESPPPLKYALDLIRDSIKRRLNTMKTFSNGNKDEIRLDYRMLSFTKLDNMRNKIEEMYLEGRIDRVARRQLRMLINELIYLDRLLTYLETYSYSLFLSYYRTLKEKAERRRVTIEKVLISDPKLKEAFIIIDSLHKKGYVHPKIQTLVDFLRNKQEKTLVFVGIKDVTLEIVNKLNEMGIPTTYLIGQLRGKGEVGMRQREQIQVLNKFREGEYKVLVATHVGEEGLDISEVKNVIFYDNPISAIRRIQREGRTGRTQPGEIYFIVLKNTRDESRYWVGRKMEKRLMSELKKLKPTFISMDKESVKPLTEFIGKHEETEKETDHLPAVIVDYRERSGKIVEYLREKGVDVKLEELPVGDYLVGRYLIERKTMHDLAQSIIDGRIFNQLKELKRQPAEILILLEGKTIDFTKRLNEKVLAGIVLSILEDYKIPIYRSLSDRESAEVIYSLLQRQIVDKKGYHRIRLERKPLETPEIQKFLIAGIPGIDSVLADKLLTHFGTIERLATASFEELLKVEGIGPQLAKRIYEVFHTIYPKAQKDKLDL